MVKVQWHERPRLMVAPSRWTALSSASRLEHVAISRPSSRVFETWFSDERSPSRRLHVSWHPAERLIVLSIWREDRCTASFRMPVQDAGRLIAAAADAMSRAISLPNRETEQPQPRWWRMAFQQVQRVLGQRVSRVGDQPSKARLRVVPTVDDSPPTPASAAVTGKQQSTQ